MRGPDRRTWSTEPGGPMSKRLRSLFLVVAARRPSPRRSPLGATASAAGAATRSRTITVVGTGEVRGKPDVADLVLGVSGRAGSAAEVMSRIADRAQKVIDALHDAGVSDDDIQTADLSVQPVYDDDGTSRATRRATRCRSASATSGRRERSSTPPRPRRVTTSGCRASPSRSTTTATLARRRPATKATKRAAGAGRAARERCRGRGRRGALDYRDDQQHARSPTPATRPRRPPAPP